MKGDFISNSNSNTLRSHDVQTFNQSIETRMRGWNFRRKHYTGSKVPNPQLHALVKQALKDRQMKQKVLANHLGVRY
jgi:hypothetical protein